MGIILGVEVKRAAVRAGSIAGSLAMLTVLAGTAMATVVAPCERAPPTVLTERFMSADCADCWSAADVVDGAVLDWIAPAAGDAPLAEAAIAEAAGRAPGLTANRPLVRQWLLPTPPPVALRVTDGFAFNGYIGLQLEVARAGRTDSGLMAYMALVERIRAGRDGATVDRQVVRSVVGPLSLGELATRSRIRHLAAVRVPAAAQAERLASVAWVEDATGRVVAFVASRSPSSSASGRCR